MTKEQKIEIVESTAEAIGGKVRPTYSGRGMFGATCYGIVHDDANEVIEEASSRGLRNAVTDNMGLQYIVYWPHITDDK
jgi:hypothetical protein